MNLGNRLMTIALQIPPGHVVADVGTDHALLPIFLIKNKVCPKVIATDINLGPLTRAKNNIKAANLEKYIEIRLGPGLMPIKEQEVQIAVISGMGGDTIAKILKNSPEISCSLSSLILQPMTKVDVLRKELFDLGFVFLDEKVAKEGEKYYQIIKVKKGKTIIPYDETDILVGPILRQKQDPVVEKFITKRVEKLEKLSYLLKNKNTNASKTALEKHMLELKILKEVLK